MGRLTPGDSDAALSSRQGEASHSRGGASDFTFGLGLGERPSLRVAGCPRLGKVVRVSILIKHQAALVARVIIAATNSERHCIPMGSDCITVERQQVSHVVEGHVYVILPGGHDRVHEMKLEWNVISHFRLAKGGSYCQQRQHTQCRER